MYGLISDRWEICYKPVKEIDKTEDLQGFNSLNKRLGLERKKTEINVIVSHEQSRESTSLKVGELDIEPHRQEYQGP
jgi:hypothetical protein